MATIIIKQAPWHGGDTKLFRAYTTTGATGLNHFGRSKYEPVGVSASTTSNTEFGAISCAAKAFIKLLPAERASDPDEVETRVKLQTITKPGMEKPGVWQATLQPKT